MFAWPRSSITRLCRTTASRRLWDGRCPGTQTCTLTIKALVFGSLFLVAFYSLVVIASMSACRALEGFEDDPLQMGGDFTIDLSSKKMTFVHLSKVVHDRPTLEEIISHLGV